MSETEIADSTSTIDQVENYQPQMKDTAFSEFKQQFYSGLRNAGVLERLKSQIRSKLINEIQQRSLKDKTLQLVSKSAALSDEKSDHSKPIEEVALESLIMDYMRIKEYEFSLSVFLPECGLNQQQIFDPLAVSQFLRIDNRSDIANLLYNHNQDSMLANLIRYIGRKFGDLSNNKESQTEPEFTERKDLLDKLHHVDEQYEYQIATSRIQNQAAIEQRMTQYQKECDQRMQMELAIAIANFKENELTNLRLQERQKYLEDVEKVRSDYESRTHERKTQLDKMEQDMENKMRLRQAEFEQSMFNDRQRLLQEFETLKAREENMRREMELNEKSIQLAEQKARSKYDDAVEKFHEAERLKNEYAMKLQDAIQQYQLQFDREHSHLTSEVRDEKARLETEQALIDEKTEQLKFYRDLTLKLQTDLNTMREANNSAQTDLKILRKENESLKISLSELKQSQFTLDSHLKQQTTSLETENTGLKRNIFDMEKLLHTKDDEIVRLKKERSETASYIHKIKKIALKWQKQAQLLHLRLETQITENEESAKKLDEEIIKNKELSREVSSIRLLLHHAQSALQTDTVLKVKSDEMPDYFNYTPSVIPSMTKTYDFARPEPPSMKPLFSSDVNIDRPTSKSISKFRKYSTDLKENVKSFTNTSVQDIHVEAEKEPEEIYSKQYRQPSFNQNEIYEQYASENSPVKPHTGKEVDSIQKSISKSSLSSSKNSSNSSADSNSEINTEKQNTKNLYGAQAEYEALASLNNVNDRSMRPNAKPYDDYISKSLTNSDLLIKESKSSQSLKQSSQNELMNNNRVSEHAYSNEQFEQLSTDALRQESSNGLIENQEELYQELEETIDQKDEDGSVEEVIEDEISDEIPELPEEQSVDKNLEKLVTDPNMQKYISMASEKHISTAALLGNVMNEQSEDVLSLSSGGKTESEPDQW